MICYVDEVGRGCLAGSVVAAAVILPPGHGIVGIKDSKKLSSKRREELDKLIREKAIAIGIGEVDNTIIDKINILQASLLAMRNGVRSLGIKPSKVLVDGANPIPYLGGDIRQEAIINGDSIVEGISAASIIAKVYRDLNMVTLDRLFPMYGWAQNKGYGTRAHKEAIRKFGPCKFHRMTFRGVKEYLNV